MMRERSEIIAFTRDDIERIVRHIAKTQITGSMFIGKFGDQSVRWTTDGGIEVITKYAEGDMTDVAPTDSVTLAIASEQPRGKKRK